MTGKRILLNQDVNPIWVSTKRFAALRFFVLESLLTLFQKMTFMVVRYYIKKRRLQMKKTVFLALLISVMLCLASTTSFAEILIIANQNVHENSLSNEEVKQIFLGKTVKWGDGSGIQFAVLKGDFHKTFLKEYIKRSSSQYNNHWKMMVFTGKGMKPTAFETEKEMVQYIAETDGAVGYVSQRTEIGNVKTIDVN
jgi:hypothetical protein